jgi:hypothetical protein
MSNELKTKEKRYQEILNDENLMKEDMIDIKIKLNELESKAPDTEDSIGLLNQEIRI